MPSAVARPFEATCARPSTIPIEHRIGGLPAWGHEVGRVAHVAAPDVPTVVQPLCLQVSPRGGVPRAAALGG